MKSTNKPKAIHYSNPSPDRLLLPAPRPFCRVPSEALGVETKQYFSPVSENLEEVTCKNCLMEVILKQREGLKSIRALIDDSEGVVGLHLNGDIADWDSLEEGGEFETWLINFNLAEALLR